MVAVTAGRLPALASADARFLDKTLRKRVKQLSAKERSRKEMEAKNATRLK
jgi:hypothetical protein